ncbi:MAG: type II toxin-antitoxin system PemK/MazF family toxin [Pyrinomonadaceae bacterium]
MAYVPRRGDAVWLNLDPQSGREQAGRRPVLVLSPSEYNAKVGLALICPITNQAKGYSFEVAVPKGLKIKGVVLSDHVKNADWRTREVDFICRVPHSIVDDVIEKLTVLLQPRR